MWLVKGGGKIRVTGQGWVRARVAGPEAGAEGARPGRREINSSGSEVVEGDRAEDGGDLARLVVEAGWG